MKSSLHQEWLCLYDEIPSAAVQRRHVSNEYAKENTYLFSYMTVVRSTPTRYQIPECCHVKIYRGSHIFTMFFSSRKVVGALAHVQRHRSSLKDL